jgi:hypothetical protein
VAGPARRYFVIRRNGEKTPRAAGPSSKAMGQYKKAKYRHMIDTLIRFALGV